MADNFTDHEKGGLVDEHQNRAKAKAAATAAPSATRTQPPSRAAPPQAPAERYALVPSDAENEQLAKLVTLCELGAANEQLPGIRKRLKSSVEKHLGYPRPDTSLPALRKAKEGSARTFKATEADIVLNLNFRLEVCRDVLFVSKRFGWNPDEVLALWQIEGLAPWLRQTTGTTSEDAKKHKEVWRPFHFDGAFTKYSADEKLARATARSQLLYQYWGLDLLVPHSWNAKAKDNALTVTTRVKDHDDAFDTGFNNEISSCLPNVTAKAVRQALSDDGIELTGSDAFRVKPKYQATFLALQHAHFKCRESQVAAKPKAENKAGMTVSLSPPFPALVYLYFNARFPDQSVQMMMRGFSGKPSFHTSTELCQVFLSSELAPEVVKSLEECRKLGLVNCHGYMNALRFEFVRQVYEVVFKNTGVGSPRGCASR